MGAVLIYLIKSSVCIALFYGCYKICLARETFFRFNRITLLAGTLLCFIIPLLQIPVSQMSTIQRNLKNVEQYILQQQPEGNEVKIKNIQKSPDIAQFYPVTRTKNAVPGFPVIQSGLFIYITGCAVSLILLLIPLYKIFKLIRSGAVKYKENTCKIVICHQSLHPFSWGRYILLSGYDNIEEEATIITHEKIHIQALHFADILLFQIFVTIQWFNPFIWLLQSELKQIHEFEVDNRMLTQGTDPVQYQLLLVKKSVGARLYSMASNFHYSKIKNRIEMMLKRKSNRWARLKVLFFVPLGGVAFHLFAQPALTASNLMLKEGTNPVLKTEQPVGTNEPVFTDSTKKVKFSEPVITKDTEIRKAVPNDADKVKTTKKKVKFSEPVITKDSDIRKAVPDDAAKVKTTEKKVKFSEPVITKDSDIRKAVPDDVAKVKTTEKKVKFSEPVIIRDSDIRKVVPDDTAKVKITEKKVKFSEPVITIDTMTIRDAKSDVKVTEGKKIKSPEPVLLISIDSTKKK